jgi:glycosyltransferase involved in cell wall biosynthesis
VTKKIIFNGKFLMAPPTGVHRVAEQLILTIDQLLDERPELRGRFDIEVFAPRKLHHVLKLKHIRFRQGGVFTHIPWEQIDLPSSGLFRGATIVSLCNLGPVAATNALTLIHDAQVHLSPDSYSKAFRLWYKLVQPLLGKRHKQILTVSEFSRTELSKAGVSPAHKTSVLHNGVDHVLTVSAEISVLTKLNLASQSFVLGLANTQKHKNVRVLLQAFSDRRLAGHTLVLFGAANMKDLEEALGADLPANVVLAGKVGDGELRALMEAALCLAFPSTTEGFGLPPLEAMTLGCPAICAPCGALPEVCGDAVLYADPLNPLSWVDAILSMSGDREQRERFVAAGYAQAAEFTWRNAADRLLSLLDPPRN